MVDENTALVTPPPGDDFLSPDVDGVWTKPEGQSFNFNWGFSWVALSGVFIVYCDDCFVISIHEEIASCFNQLSISHWLVTAFNSGWALSLPIYGRLYDIYGGKNTLLAAYTLYAAGCIIMGTAASMQIAILGRFIAGIGASGTTDFISVLITEIAPLRQVAMLRMYLGAIAMLGVGSSAPLGGLIASLLGWRWSFLGQAPILLVCLVIVASKLPNQTSEEAQPHPAHEHADRPEDRRMDFFGIAFLGITVASFILICTAFTDESELNIYKWELLATLALFGTLFVANEAFWARDPLIPLKLAMTNGIGLAWLTQLLLNIAIYSLSTNIGEFFVRTEYTPTSTVGLYIVPGSVGLLIGQIIGGQYIKRSGRYKTFSVLCLWLCFLGFLFVMLRWPSGPSHWELLYTFFMAVGASGVLAAQFIGLSASAPHGSSAAAITVYCMSQQLGKVGGTTLASTISRGVLRRGLLRQFGKGTEELQVVKQVLSNTRFAQSLPDRAQHIIRATYMESFRIVPIISLCAVVLALPLLAFQTEYALA